MIPRIIFILCIVVFISCKKDGNNGNDGNKSYDITITGVISDQVTGQPVSGATVSCGVQRFGMSGEGLMLTKDTTLSGTDGTYKLITQSPHGMNVPLSSKGDCIALIAAKQGFPGSMLVYLDYWNAQNSVINIQLYHYSQLNLHIKNDTINNNIDQEYISIIRHGIYEFMTDCKGRKIDTIYEINKLWGNLRYYMSQSNSGGIIYDTITLKPDIINSFDIIF